MAADHSVYLLTAGKGGGLLGHGLLAKLRLRARIAHLIQTNIYRYYFAKKFQYIIEAARALAFADAEKTPPPCPYRVSPLLSPRSVLSAVDETSREPSVDERREEKPKKKKCFMRKLRPDMIRRMDNAPQLVDPSGWISEGVQSPNPRSPERSEKSSGERPQHLTFAAEQVSSPKPISGDPLPVSPSPSNLRPLDVVQSGLANILKRRRLSDPGRVSPLPPSSPITRASIYVVVFLAHALTSII
jgi:hypothetical protein